MAGQAEEVRMPTETKSVSWMTTLLGVGILAGLYCAVKTWTFVRAIIGSFETKKEG